MWVYKCRKWSDILILWVYHLNEPISCFRRFWGILSLPSYFCKKILEANSVDRPWSMASELCQKWYWLHMSAKMGIHSRKGYLVTVRWRLQFHTDDANLLYKCCLGLCIVRYSWLLGRKVRTIRICVPRFAAGDVLQFYNAHKHVTRIRIFRSILTSTHGVNSNSSTSF